MVEVTLFYLQKHVYQISLIPTVYIFTSWTFTGLEKINKITRLPLRIMWIIKMANNCFSAVIFELEMFLAPIYCYNNETNKKKQLK